MKNKKNNHKTFQGQNMFLYSDEEPANMEENSCELRLPTMKYKSWNPL